MSRPVVGSCGNAFFRELADALRKAGSGSPEAEADWILSELSGASGLGQSRDWVPDEEQRAKALGWVAGRAERRPLQYLLGHAPFFGLELEVTPDVLIPRPETEILVEKILDQLPPDGRLLDIGTGSGAIALAVAAERNDIAVLALDVSEAALAVAQRNAAKLHLPHVEFRLSDLCSALREEETFDVIAANLPYISEKEYALCEPEITRFEPRLALVADDGGMALTKCAAQEARSHLKPGGAVIFEIQYDQGAALKSFLAAAGYADCRILKDYNGFDRFVSARVF